MTVTEVDLLWRTAPTPYQRRIQEFLGDCDPLDVLSRTSGELERIVAETDIERLRARPEPGKWTPNEILGHLADTEWAHGWRLRTVLGNERPVVVGFDQEGWVRTQGHNGRDPQEHLDAFSNLREVNLRLLRRLGADDFARVGQHHARGPPREKDRPSAHRPITVRGCHAWRSSVRHVPLTSRHPRAPTDPTAPVAVPEAAGRSAGS